MYNKKNFYKSVMILVVPMALQNLINVGITATDVVMLGRVGEKALAGASLAGQVQFIMTLIFFGLSSGASVLIAQYWGKQDIKTIEKIVGISMKLGLVVGVTFTLAAFAFPQALMGIMTNDAEVIQEGIKYLRIVCCSYTLCSITNVYLNALRSVEKVLISTVVYGISLIVNFILNSIFIFGLLGFPKMGVAGAALGTLAARITEITIVIIYDRKLNKVFRFKLSMMFIKDKILQKDFINFSMPVVLNELMWGSGVAAIAAILGHMGSSVSAANSVVQMTRQLAIVISMGIANATAIMIGKVLGEGKMELAKQYGKQFAWLSVVSGLGGAVVVLIARPLLISNLILTEEAKQCLSMMMLVMSYYVVGQAFNTVMIVGAFRAGGDTKFGLFLDVTFMWVVSIALGALAAFVFKLNIVVVYLILMSDEVIKIPITYWRYRSFKWIRNVTR